MKARGILVTVAAVLLLMQCPQVLAQPTDANDPVTLKCGQISEVIGGRMK